VVANQVLAAEVSNTIGEMHRSGSVSCASIRAFPSGVAAARGATATDATSPGDRVLQEIDGRRLDGLLPR